MSRALSSRRLSPVRAAGLWLFVLALGACASGGNNLRLARIAEQQQDYDLAVAEYTKAARSHPDDRTIRLSLDRAKLRASQDHFARARRHAATGKTNEALVEYQLASELNPGNGEIQDELRTLRAQMRTQVALDRGGKTTIEALIKDSLAAPSSRSSSWSMAQRMASLPTAPSSSESLEAGSLSTEGRQVESAATSLLAWSSRFLALSSSVMGFLVAGLPDLPLVVFLATGFLDSFLAEPPPPQATSEVPTIRAQAKR